MYLNFSPTFFFFILIHYPNFLETLGWRWSTTDHPINYHHTHYSIPYIYCSTRTNHMNVFRIQIFLILYYLTNSKDINSTIENQTKIPAKVGKYLPSIKILGKYRVLFLFQLLYKTLWNLSHIWNKFKVMIGVQHFWRYFLGVVLLV